MFNQIALTFFALLILLTGRGQIVLAANRTSDTTAEEPQNSRDLNLLTSRANVDDLEPSSDYQNQCSNKSILLARQYLTYQLESTKLYNNFWFNDLDRTEILDEQRASLSSIIMSSDKRLAEQFLDTTGQPTYEIEASYFRPFKLAKNKRQLHHRESLDIINLKLNNQFKHICHLDSRKRHYVYRFQVSIGPLEHNLDIVYHLPKKFRLSQPIDWRYAQVKIIVPNMTYEIELQQRSENSLLGGCPIEISDVTYLMNNQLPAFNAIIATGIASTNGTGPELSRFFHDFTRPAISTRVKEAMKFYLNDKTLPLTLVA